MDTMTIWLNLGLILLFVAGNAFFVGSEIAISSARRSRIKQMAEMGDKTQIATVMLAAQYQAWIWVVAGTTLGMMLANAPVVWLGERLTRMLPIRGVHMVSAGVFCVLGILALLGWG